MTTTTAAVATDRIELIGQPLLRIAGNKADSLYMTGEAFE